MAEELTLARPYAEAVFKLSPDATASARWSATLAFLELLLRDPDMIERLRRGRRLLAEGASCVLALCIGAVLLFGSPSGANAR